MAGVAAFALFKGNSGTVALPALTVWGTFPADIFNDYVAKVNNGLSQQMVVKYVQESASGFSQDFIAALARGTGPDAILIPADMLLPHEDKLALIPFSAFPQRTFIDSYIDEAGMYLVPNGIMAVPFTVDPLIMYWNRDMFNAAGVAAYPRYWDEFTSLNQKLTAKDQNGNIRKSAIAMGEFSNMDNARELFGTLLMQLGNPVTVMNSDGTAVSTIKNAAAADPSPALQFFSQFVDPSNANYSWNKGLADSKSAFLSGTLATYFGFASEIADIRAKNPNLNFDAALLPQLRTGGVKATYGRMYGFSIVRASPNPNAVFQVVSALTQPQNLSMLSQTMYLPPVRRDIISQGSTDPYISIFDQAALVSKAWPDVSALESQQIFGDMVQSFTSGQKTLYQAIQDAGDQYDVVLKQGMQ